jgi:HPt (histidine-containing phosphotransfer) domain-containing protein
MSLKIICRRPDSSLETAGGKTLPLFAGDLGHALSPSGRADAKQPGETASRLLRIVPAEPENPICWRSFAVLQSLLSPAELPAAVALSLINMEQGLLRIARSRAERDFPSVTQETRAIERIAGNLGALHARAAAQLLEEACQARNYAATYGLISALSQACDEADTELNSWLASTPVLREA